MTPLLEIVIFFTLFTFIVVFVCAAIRSRQWTAKGRAIGLGNRDNMEDATPLGGRAERAAQNSLEAAIFFLPLAFVAHAVGMDSEVLFGAQVAVSARVLYVAIYLAGIIYVRSLVWGIGVIGYGMMIFELVK